MLLFIFSLGKMQNQIYFNLFPMRFCTNLFCSRCRQPNKKIDALGLVCNKLSTLSLSLSGPTSSLSSPAPLRNLRYIDVSVETLRRLKQKSQFRHFYTKQEEKEKEGTLYDVLKMAACERLEPTWRNLEIYSLLNSEPAKGRNSTRFPPHVEHSWNNKTIFVKR